MNSNEEYNKLFFIHGEHLSVCNVVLSRFQSLKKFVRNIYKEEDIIFNFTELNKSNYYRIDLCDLKIRRG